MDGAFLYILRCADHRYYVGTSRKEMETRLAEPGFYGGYTARRRPIGLVFAQHFESALGAVAAERQVKGWSRAKKEALIRGDFGQLSRLAQRRGPHPSRRPPSAGSSG
jgi:putative endonuclease